MPIGFRCTGCRARLHVPHRWGGTTVPCPKCGTRVVVPVGVQTAEPSAFERPDVERSLAMLEVSAAGVSAARSPGGIFADDTFELPSAEAIDASEAAAEADRNGISLSRRAVYAYLIVVPVVAVVAFLLGSWWRAIAGQ